MRVTLSAYCFEYKRQIVVEVFASVGDRFNEIRHTLGFSVERMLTEMQRLSLGHALNEERVTRMLNLFQSCIQRGLPVSEYAAGRGMNSNS